MILKLKDSGESISTGISCKIHLSGLLTISVCSLESLDGEEPPLDGLGVGQEDGRSRVEVDFCQK